MTDIEEGLRRIYRIERKQLKVLLQIRNILGAAGEAAAEEAADEEGAESDNGDQDQGDDQGDEKAPEPHGARRIG